MNLLSCFKAYDIRGKVPDDLNEDLAYRIGRAFVEELQAKSVVIGFDIRLESPLLAEALIHGVTVAGAQVINIGLCGTEEVYFGTCHYETDGGIMVTASHNPKGYNGMKLVARDAKPISGDTGLQQIHNRVVASFTSGSPLIDINPSGQVTEAFDKSAYVAHILSYINTKALKPLKIVMDSGNGSAGIVIREIAQQLPINAIYINDTPDGNFPNGVPNPLLPEKRMLTEQAIREHQADFGIAWDGDFDRCFFFDGSGNFIEGYYVVGLLAESLLAKNPGAKIIHDPRLTWNTIEQVQQAGGIAVQSKTGHAFIKERMRLENALYGGEMSAHHYFKEFAYCDSGMIPWLLIAELASKTGKSLNELVAERMAAFPCSGEINYTVADIQAVLDKLLLFYADQNPVIDKTDGISMDFVDWRMNIRASNTEPLLRLNVESRGSMQLVRMKVHQIEQLIKS